MKRTNGKTKHSSTAVEESQRKVSWQNEYLSAWGFKLNPTSKAWLLHLAAELIDYIWSNEQVYNIKSFLVFKGINPQVWSEWMARCPELKEANEHAKMILAVRRESGMLERRLEPNAVRYSMPLYCDEWKALEAERTQIKAKIQAGQKEKEVIVVNMPQFPSSDLVPERKKDE